MTPKPVQTFIFFHFRSHPNRSQERLVFPRILPMKTAAWLGAESNRRHVDFQSTALPTELPSRLPMKIDTNDSPSATVIDFMLTFSAFGHTLEAMKRPTLRVLAYRH